MTLSPWLGAAGMIILGHISSLLLTLIFISVAFPPRPLGTGRHFQTLLSPLLKVPRMVLLRSLLWWELGTSFPDHGPGVWLSFWRDTGKQFWFWFWCIIARLSYIISFGPYGKVDLFTFFNFLAATQNVACYRCLHMLKVSEKNYFHQNRYDKWPATMINKRLFFDPKLAQTTYTYTYDFSTSLILSVDSIDRANNDGQLGNVTWKHTLSCSVLTCCFK